MSKDIRAAGMENKKISESVLWNEEQAMIGTVLIVVLILALLGVFPRWSHSRNWGYAPSGGIGTVLLIVVVLVLLGRL
jgi:O-antigen ligase